MTKQTRAKRQAFGRALCQCYLATTSSLAYLANPTPWGKDTMTPKEREYLDKLIKVVNQDMAKLRELGNRLQRAGQ